MAQPGPSAQTEGTAGAAARPAQPRARLGSRAGRGARAAAWAPSAGHGPGGPHGAGTRREGSGERPGEPRREGLGRGREAARVVFLGCKCGARAAPGAHGAGITLAGGRAAAGERELSPDGTRPPRPGTAGGGEGWRRVRVQTLILRGRDAVIDSAAAGDVCLCWKRHLGRFRSGCAMRIVRFFAGKDKGNNRSSLKVVWTCAEGS